MKRRKKALATLLTAAAATAVFAAAPASADCLYAEAYYDRPGKTRQYVVGPKKCVVSTPYGNGVNPTVYPAGSSAVITVGGGLWIPVP